MNDHMKVMKFLVIYSLQIHIHVQYLLQKEWNEDQMLMQLNLLGDEVQPER